METKIELTRSLTMARLENQHLRLEIDSLRAEVEQLRHGGRIARIKAAALAAVCVLKREKVSGK